MMQVIQNNNFKQDSYLLRKSILIFLKGGIRMGKIRKTQRGNETTAPPVELNELRSAIQKLTQSTNPLGKCMDYVHDDLDTMR